MKKKIICTILVTALAVTSFTGCGKAQDKDAAEVIIAETETRNPDITAEAQASVDTLLPTETQKPVVTETATPTPKPVATKEPETTATPKPAATATPKAMATPKPATATAGSAAATVSNSKPSGDSNKTGTTATAAPAEKETPAATAKPAASTPAPTPVPTLAPCNHNYEKKYWPSAPTCNGGGDWTMVCSICGAVGATGTDPALPHTPETKVVADATYCNEHGVMVTYCTSCGAELDRVGFDGTEHEWVTDTEEEWDEETHTVVEKEVTYCSRCHAQR